MPKNRGKEVRIIDKESGEDFHSFLGSQPSSQSFCCILGLVGLVVPPSQAGCKHEMRCGV